MNWGILFSSQQRRVPACKESSLVLAISPNKLSIIHGAMLKEWRRLRYGGEHLRPWIYLKKATKKSVLYIYCRFHQAERFRFSVDDTWNRKKIPCAIEWKPISVDRWKGSKMLAWWRNYFASFSSKWKRGLLKIHKWGRGLHSGQIAGVPPD